MTVEQIKASVNSERTLSYETYSTLLRIEDLLLRLVFAVEYDNKSLATPVPVVPPPPVAQSPNFDVAISNSKTPDKSPRMVVKK
jgi:hypothetical protein